MLNITENLLLQSIEANNWKHDDRDREVTTCWVLFFSFFGVEGFSAFVTDKELALPHANFSMIESEEGDLHESFCEQLEEHWTVIVESVKKWEAENFKAQTAEIKRIERNRIDAGLI